MDHGKDCPKLQVGKHFHLFDQQYLLLGLNYQLPEDGRIFEVEASYTPFISDSLTWAGLWAMAGTASHSHIDPWDDSRFRFGGGIATGWRMLAIDSGLLRVAYNHGGKRTTREIVRMRYGVVLAQELTAPTERASCCSRKTDPGNERALAQVKCECDRIPMGLSLFIYYANEFSLGNKVPPGASPIRDRGDMFGLSLKFGLGL